jgi:hypothetical protein
VVFTAAGIRPHDTVRSMTDPRPLRLSARTRAAAWIVTGPVGHLYGGVADWAELLARYALASARERLRVSRSRAG